MFYQKVDLRSRSDMIDFLTNHYRYNTMNSWNQSTSYANKMKIHSVIPSEFSDKAFELFETEDFYFEINDLIHFFDESHNYEFQAGFNGRSAGYLVLYTGSREPKVIFDFDNKPKNEIEPDDRDYADNYGWRSYKECKKQGLYKKTIYKIGCWPGKSIDQSEDFEDWDNYSLKKRVKLIQDFDRLCDDIVNSTIELCKNAEVIEESYQVTKTRKVIA